MKTTSVAKNPSRIARWLSRANAGSFTFFTALTAFILYTCVYGFRKTFAVGTFEGTAYAGIDYKVWLVIAQVLGYAVSKFIGIKVVSELKSGWRAAGVLILVAIAGFSWLLFAITPRPYNVLFLFTNGLPLGMIWGLIFSYLEGRQTTEALGAGLSVSFIFSAGFSKTIGAYVMQVGHVSESWMPFVACLIFTPPLLLTLWLIEQVPPPTLEDERLRTKRRPMDHGERRKFVTQFGPALVCLIAAYVMLTVLRDFRDNFAAEFWRALGIVGSPEIFTTTEIPISVIVLIAIGSLIFIRDNRIAFFTNLYMVIAGFALMGLSTWAFMQHWMNAWIWMTCLGFGLYLAYVPFNCVLFERMIAAFRIPGTVGFVMYLADSFGYAGSVGVLIYKEFAQPNIGWINFLTSASLTVSIGGFMLSALSIAFFDRKFRPIPKEMMAP